MSGDGEIKSGHLSEGTIANITLTPTLRDRIVYAQKNDVGMDKIRQRLSENDPQVQCFHRDSEGVLWFQDRLVVVVGFLGYPQPGGGAHPPIPSEGVLGEELGDWADLALRQAHKNSRFRVVRAAGA